ncbi:MAG: amidohydrolase, partial [Clostridiales Family XIII bacterium]|nr:amidohydrolase [Clostridiales Family XIII bacterium]
MQNEMLIRNAMVFDGVRDDAFAGYVAVGGGRILSVGPGDGAEYERGGVRVVDANGGTVMAGFHDSHTHLLMAGMFDTHVNLAGCRSEAESVAKVAASAEAAADTWVIGFGWHDAFWDEKRLPTFKSLDAAFPNRPVMLLNAEAHGVWVNSRALEIAGIGAHTEDPFGGEIVRLIGGRPSGVLLEGACGLVTRYAYEFDADREKALIRSFMRRAAAYGVTSVNDVMPFFHGNIGHIPVYSDMDRAGELTVRIHAAPDLLGDLDEVLSWQSGYSSDRLRVAHVKQFLDGVSTAHTALMLEPYSDSAGGTGARLFPLDEIREAVSEAHRRGLSVKLHSCGDASVRFALDCYEEAIRRYGDGRSRHAIEHCELVADADIPRFGNLGVLPSVQPEHLALTRTFAENPYRVTMGEARAARTWPLKSLLLSAGRLSIGSDCPVTDNNPFPGIYRAVTRVHDDGEPKGGWNPAEKLTLAEVLRGYTIGSAWGALRAHELGSLEPGKFADIAVIDRDLFAAARAGDYESIKEAQTNLTIMDGKVVYER